MNEYDRIEEKYQKILRLNAAIRYQQQEVKKAQDILNSHLIVRRREIVEFFEMRDAFKDETGISHFRYKAPAP